MDLTIKYYFLDQEDNDGTEILNLKDFDYPHFLPECDTSFYHSLFFSNLIRYLKNYKTVTILTTVKNSVISEPWISSSDKEYKIALSKLNKYEGLNKYGITDAICPLCNRHMPAKERSSHHLIPVAEESDNSKRETIHRICHIKIHSLFTEEELALKYNSIEKLKEHEEIKKFIKWLKNKPDNFYDVSRQDKTRHDRRY
jgi:hypothetical protein